MIKKKEKGKNQQTLADMTNYGTNQQTLADMTNYKDIENTIFFWKKKILHKEEHIKRAKKGTLFGRTDKIANETKQKRLFTRNNKSIQS